MVEIKGRIIDNFNVHWNAPQLDQWVALKAVNVIPTPVLVCPSKDINCLADPLISVFILKIFVSPLA